MLSYFEFYSEQGNPIVQKGLFNRATSFKLLDEVNKPKPIYASRWMIRRDIEAVTEIACRGKAQSEKKRIKRDLEDSLSDPNMLGLVCEDKDGEIIGFVIFASTNTFYQILILNTKKDAKKVIESLLSRIFEKLGSQGTPRQKCKVVVKDNKNSPSWWYKLLKDYGFDGREVGEQWMFTYYSQKGFGDDFAQGLLEDNS